MDFCLIQYLSGSVSNHRHSANSGEDARNPMHGDPNGEGVPDWPAFSDTNPEVMYFSQTPHLGPVPSAQSLKALDAYFAWRRTPDGEAWAK